MSSAADRLHPAEELERLLKGVPLWWN